MVRPPRPYGTRSSRRTEAHPKKSGPWRKTNPSCELRQIHRSSTVSEVHPPLVTWVNHNSRNLHRGVREKSRSTSPISTTFKMSSAKALMASFGNRPPPFGIPNVDFASQLCPPQALRSKSCDQEDHSVRPFDVLLAHATRNETSPLLQSRKHHLNPRHSKTTELRDFHRSLSHPGERDR